MERPGNGDDGPSAGRHAGVEEGANAAGEDGTGGTSRSSTGARGGNRLTAPDGWSRVAGDDYTIHADHRIEETVAFAQSVARGLEDQPRWLHCRYLYDARGSEIYERITEQPEYYLTRTEASILETHAADVRELAGSETLVELGSGSSAKTRLLLDAWTEEGACRYIPIDISATALESACEELSRAYPELAVEGVAASYERGMSVVDAASPFTLLFLGSTIGNLNNAEMDEFLEMLGNRLAEDDHLLLGIDLIKEPGVLEAAYNDAAGWTERFNRNLFRRMNDELGCEIALDAVEHVAYFNERLSRVEIYARFLQEVRVDLAAIDRSFRIAAGEMILIEISRKFRVGDMLANVSRFGFAPVEVFSDADDRFALLLLRRRARPSRVATRRTHLLQSLLRRVRTRTLELASSLDEESLYRRPSPLMGPLIWDLGHIAAFEELWLVRQIDRRPGLDGGEAGSTGERAGGDEGGGASAAGDASAAPEIERFYDPFHHPRSGRHDLELPDLQEVRERLARVRGRALERLRSGVLDPADPLTADGFVYRMVAQHESQHQETMLQAIQLFDDVLLEPADTVPVSRPERDLVDRTVLVPAGRFTLGTEDRGVAYDNERPRHWVELPAFRIDAAPVTNGEFLEFVEDGGYRRRELWSDGGWEWLREAEADAPMSWCRIDGQWYRRRFGRLRALDPKRPVIHVSWFEADAYARWTGKRLPTEAEWEKAAAWNPATGRARTYPWGKGSPTRERANLDQRLLEPTPVGTYPAGRSFYGCHQMLGDVWEWTATTFDAYPGFEAFPYREYSEVFFDEGYKVLRGCSWAVPTFAARTTYRNWDLPRRRHIFAGFRCVTDA